MASATPATLSTRLKFEKSQRAFRAIAKAKRYLSRAGKHSLARIQPRPTGILNFLNFRALFSYDRAHPGVGNHKLDRNRATTGDGRDIERLVIDTANNKAKSLVDHIRMQSRRPHRGLTFETASSGPLTLRMRSGLPATLSETITLAPLFSLISLTCLPPRPMIIDASCVTMRQRM